MVTDGASGEELDNGLYGFSYAQSGGERQDSFTNYLKNILPREGLQIRSGAGLSNLCFLSQFRLFLFCFVL